MAGTVRTAIATFNDPELLEAAVIDLEEHGFDRAEISLLAGERTVEKKLGHRYARVDEIGDTDDTPNRAFVEKGDYTEAKSGLIGGLFYVGALAAAGAVVASGGTLAVVLGATLISGGTGAAIGTVLARWLDDHHARYLQEQIDRGGLLLWVTLRNADRQKKALEVLHANNAHDVHIHDFPVPPTEEKE